MASLFKKKTHENTVKQGTEVQASSENDVFTLKIFWNFSLHDLFQLCVDIYILH